MSEKVTWLGLEA